MSRRKVAVFGNAWGYEFFKCVFAGISKYSQENDVDVDFFVSYAALDILEGGRDDEYKAFWLANIEDYDGAIVLANSLNIAEEKEYITDVVYNSEIPCICLEYELDGMSYMGSENYSGMYELAEHMLGYHGYKEVLYIGGPRDNSEAQERLKAVADAARKYNVSLDKDNLYYGNWSYYCGIDIINDYHEKHGKYPQVVICANDSMAEGLCEHLNKIPGLVPGENIAISGFDALSSALNFYPSITTVGRNWDDMGYNAMEFVLGGEFNYDEPKRIVLKSRLVVGESCGCKACEEDSDIRSINARKIARMQGGNVSFDIHMRNIYSNIHDVYTKEEFHNRLNRYYPGVRDTYETENFFYCVEDRFFDVNAKKKSKSRAKMFSGSLSAIVGFYNNKPMDIVTLDKGQLLPSYAKYDKARMFFYRPFFVDDEIIGYGAVSAEERQLEQYLLYVWSRHLYQDFEQVKRNIEMEDLKKKLMRLSITDSLTGIYNRTGYNEIIKPFYDKCVKENKRIGVIMCDIDSMKEINDNYGHLQGDLAICTLANALKKNVSEKSYACRYGGDEFIIVEECESEADLENFIKKIEENIQEEAKASHLQFDLVASVGGVLIEPEDVVDFEIAIKIADDKMYMIKSEHKKKTGGTIR